MPPRIQELSASVGPERETVHVALWDVSGSQQYKRHWDALAQVSMRWHRRACMQVTRCARGIIAFVVGLIDCVFPAVPR